MHLIGLNLELPLKEQLKEFIKGKKTKVTKECKIMQPL